MRKKRNKEVKEKVKPINEGVYDFYDAYDTDERTSTSDKIINYYIDKIRKYGQNSLTKQEVEIFNDAKKGKLSLDKSVYKRNKITGDIELDNLGTPIRLDKDILIPGVPFLTSKGKGGKKKQSINGRIYWDIDGDHRTYYYYVYDKDKKLIIWKTYSVGKEFGGFIVPKGEATLSPDELWKSNNNKFDRGMILDKETYDLFVTFNELWHKNKKLHEDKLKLTDMYNKLKNYTGK